MDNDNDNKTRSAGIGGARSKLTPELMKNVFDLIVAGHKNVDICKGLGISESQFYAWQEVGNRAYSAEFSENVALAREILRQNRLSSMEASLYQIATGYDAEESKTEVATDKTTKKVYVKKKVTFHKHFPPNVNALTFALTNLDPEHWKQRQTSEITGKDGKDLIQKEINLDELTDEQKAAILSLGEKALRDKEKNVEE
jgi:hypothetical protein